MTTIKNVATLLLGLALLIMAGCKKDRTPPTPANAAPVASAVNVTGIFEVNKTLTATYTYADAESDAQSGSTFKWYVANDATGTGESAIAGATNLTYLIQATEQGKYIRFGVTPKAATGTATGTEVKSAWLGAVGEATTVTFTYNGASVTYGILTSATTGKKWLDRNLGAANAPTAYNDWANYGDLFQWGRAGDGHQLITRTGPANANVTAVNGATPVTPPYQTVSTNTPGHSLFIVNGDSPNDWRIPQNDNLWQGVGGINNPCPSGFRLATQAEWTAENLGTLTEAYTKLKITLSGLRSADGAAFFQTTTSGRYWTSTLDPSFPISIFCTVINTTGTTMTGAPRANGLPCRCIKN